jgi:hypothetical protein
MTVTSKEDAVRSVVMDYVEGGSRATWVGCNGRFILSWSSAAAGSSDDPDALETLSAREMIDATADGEGCREDAADRRIEIRIDHLSRGIAGVQCFCHCHVDLLHLIDMQDGWKIVNAAWRLR